ncbi:MAG: DnaJ domain-containing protein [Coriobacteriia bacterium]|nr:DnaJ domain-containing protein [Coriobacteriia bacterium]
MAMNPYEILGVPESASQDEVKRAYRKKARENHPDLNPGDANAAKRMNQINEAYDRIMNPDKYATEDARRAAAEGRANPQQQQRYQQYQGQRRTGWQGDFGFDPFEEIFGGFTTVGPIHPEAQVSDSPEIKQAISLINNKQPKEASKILYTVKSADRNGRWYYIVALANQGMGNTMLANDQIKKALDMEPNNQEYINAARVIASSGRTYQQTSQRRGFSTGFMDPGMLCCMCIMINMCIGGGFGVPMCVRF